MGCTWMSWLLNAVACMLVMMVVGGGAAGATGDTGDTKSIPLRTHSLSAPYLDSDMSSRWFDFGGDVIIRADRYIRLAADSPSQSGWLFSRIPLTATNWEVEFEFEISGKGNLHGDGFALWVTKERAQPGNVFGHADRFEGLGVFFDTYKNNRPGVVFPYVMAMLGDGKTTYDSANDGKANEIGGCSARGLRGSAITPKAKLTYFQDKSLTLQLQYKSVDTWTECFSLTNNDVPGGIKMPNTAYLGFSAHTGELSDNFDIISVDTRNLYNPVGSQQSSNRGPSRSGKGRSAKVKQSGSWLGFFFKLALCVGVVVGGYFGYTAWRANKRYSRF